MKKKILIIVISVLLLVLVGLLLIIATRREAAPEPTVTQPPVTTAPPTEAPTEPTETEPPVPETVSGKAIADRTEVMLMLLARDTAVDIVGEYEEDYYIIATEQGFGLIEKQLVRLEGETPNEAWTGYAVSNAKVYTNYHLLSEAEQTLSMNTEVHVLEDLETCLVVQLESGIRYMSLDDVSRIYLRPAPSGGGGSSGGADGGDISLSARGGATFLSNFIEQSGEVTGKGTVLVDDAEVLLGWFEKDDEIAIVNEEGFSEPKEGWLAVYLGEFYGYIRENLVYTEDQEVYAEWAGFAYSQAALYDNYYLSGEPVNKLKANTELQVLWDLGNCYQVRVDETIGYMMKDQVSESYINYSSGGGGGNSGGDWTPPAM